MNEKPRVSITDWAEIHVGRYSVLHGVIGEGHPRMPPNTRVFTSQIVNLDLEKAECETKNTVYILGTRRAS